MWTWPWLARPALSVAACVRSLTARLTLRTEHQVCTPACITVLWCSFQNKPENKFLHSSELRTQHQTALTRTHKTQPGFNPIYCARNASVTGYQHLNTWLHHPQGQNCFYRFYFYNSNQQKHTAVTWYTTINYYMFRNLSLQHQPVHELLLYHAVTKQYYGDWHMWNSWRASSMRGEYVWRTELLHSA